MRIAYVAAELAPYAQVGGLADVARWLPDALARAGHEVVVVAPHYDVLDAGGSSIEELARMELGPFGTVSVSELFAAGPDGLRTLLIGSERWFQRGAIYDGAPDEAVRFGALTAAVAAASDVVGWVPEVVHANDWHTGLLRRLLRGSSLEDVPMVFTIHNLAYQGVITAEVMGQMGFGSSSGTNSLREAVGTADMVTTVSPTFAQQITTPAHGVGLDSNLRALGDRLVGILNGVGDEWDPTADEWIPSPYSSPDGKAPNTNALRERMGLTDRRDVPILGIVSRMDEQKGFGLVAEVVPPLLDAGRIQMAVLGRGDPRVEGLFTRLAADFPGMVAVERAFDRGLGHLIEAGSDMFLMPSRFEPCGLNQMYSMAYGTVPIVHRTGGLADSVEEWDGVTGTGFLFEPHSAQAFGEALGRALTAFGDGSWPVIQANGMSGDYSWGARVAEYEAVYERAVVDRR